MKASCPYCDKKKPQPFQPFVLWFSSQSKISCYHCKLPLRLKQVSSVVSRMYLLLLVVAAFLASYLSRVYILSLETMSFFMYFTILFSLTIYIMNFFFSYEKDTMEENKNSKVNYQIIENHKNKSKDKGGNEN